MARGAQSCHPAALRRETLEGAHRGISQRAARESPSGRAPERLGSARQTLTEELTRSVFPPIMALEGASFEDLAVTRSPRARLGTVQSASP